MNTRTTAHQALAELAEAFGQIDETTADLLARELLQAGKIVCFGLGREGLMIRAFCMRLMHLGLNAHVAGDVTAPPIGQGDVLLAAAGPGDLLLVRSMIQLAHGAGARVVVVTAQPDGPEPRAADVVVHIPAQTMADDHGSSRLLPMGTAFEIAMLIYFDLVAQQLQELTGQTPGDLRARHTNLE